MRHLGFLASTVVVLFWITMNGLLIRREVEYRSLDQYRRGVADFLGERVRRERWMGIFQKEKRIGHTGFAIERRLDADRIGFRIEFSTLIELDLLGRGGRIALQGTAGMDSRMVPEDLKAQVAVGGLDLSIDGRREGERFAIALVDGARTVFRETLPLRELHLGDGLAPVPPIAGLRVGETYRVPVFDPIFRIATEAETEVVSAESREVDGILLDCLRLETRYRGMTFRSYVTRDGEVLRQEIPPPLDVVLIREPPPLRRDRP